MKLNHDDSTAAIQKLTMNPNRYDLGITDEGYLQLSSPKRLYTTDYILIINDNWYAGKGPRKDSSQEIPEKGLPLGLYTPTKLGIFLPDGMEYITPKKSCSPTFRFLAYIHTQNALSFFYANGAFSSGVHRLNLRDIDEMRHTLELIVQELVRYWLPDAANRIQQFTEAAYGEE